MTAHAHASVDRLGGYWVCTPCIDYGLGFDDLEDAQDAADDHNRVHHRGENPDDDDYYDKYREDRRGTR